MRFKKGNYYHLDQFYDIQAFVLIDNRMKPYKNKFIHKNNWDADMTDEYIALKNFVVEVKY